MRACYTATTSLLFDDEGYFEQMILGGFSYVMITWIKEITIQKSYSLRKKKSNPNYMSNPTPSDKKKKFNSYYELGHMCVYIRS